MANYPTSLDAFTNPTSVDSLNSPSHSDQHANANDAIEALEAKVGIGTSTAGSATAGHVLVASTGGTTSWTTVGAGAISTTGGSAGQVLTAGTAGVAEWAYSGLTLVKTQTIGTAVSSVTVSDAFSATYDAYKIFITDGVGSTNNQFRLTLGASATAYYYAFSGMSYSTTGPSAGSYGRSNVAYYEAGNATTNFMCLDVDLINPFLAKYTIFKSHQVDASSAYLFNGLHQVATSYTAFTLTASSGTWTGGTIRIYGYRNS